ncbi:MAG TPA: hypothetical protein VFD70_09675 [Anaerolineae bacterium]|nr:hypothetical protein [Anaerolineae bacterium]
MDRIKSWANTHRRALIEWTICVVPSVLVLGIAVVGAVLRLPLFHMTWDNTFLFALLVLALVSALSRIPLLLLRDDIAPCVSCAPSIPDHEGNANPSPRSILEVRLQYLQVASEVEWHTENVEL